VSPEEGKGWVLASPLGSSGVICAHAGSIQCHLSASLPHPSAVIPANLDEGQGPDASGVRENDG